MSLQTHSAFYYGFVVSADALFIDFDEGGPELTAELNLASYSLTDFVTEVARAMNDVGGQLYTVSVNRATRIITISAPGAFTLLGATGSHSGTTALGLAGFAAADTSAAVSHAGGAAGGAYNTQFILQSHIDPQDNKSSTYATVNKSASGRIEVVSYGNEEFLECEIKFANDYNAGPDVPIRFNASGVDDLRALMNYLITKGPLEFMEDEDSPSSFITVLLDSTAEDKNGVKFKLKEMYSMGLPGYFETGKLTFRVIED